MCCSPWGHRGSDTTERLNGIELNILLSLIHCSLEPNRRTSISVYNGKYMHLTKSGHSKIHRFGKGYKMTLGHPVCAVVKNLPASARDMDLITDPGRSHVQWSS